MWTKFPPGCKKHVSRIRIWIDGPVSWLFRASHNSSAREKSRNDEIPRAVFVLSSHCFGCVGHVGDDSLAWRRVSIGTQALKVSNEPRVGKYLASANPVPLALITRIVFLCIANASHSDLRSRWSVLPPWRINLRSRAWQYIGELTQYVSYSKPRTTSLGSSDLLHCR